jgi:hypothetical protein
VYSVSLCILREERISLLLIVCVACLMRYIQLWLVYLHDERTTFASHST